MDEAGAELAGDGFRPVCAGWPRTTGGGGRPEIGAGTGTPQGSGPRPWISHQPLGTGRLRVSGVRPRVQRRPAHKARRSLRPSPADLNNYSRSRSPVDTLTSGNWEHLTRLTEDYLSRLRNGKESTEFFTLTSGEQLAITPSSVAFFNLYEDSLEHQILGLLSPQDDKTVAAVYLGAGWCPLDEALTTSDNRRQELVQVRSVGERIVLYLLNRMICGNAERPPDVLPFRPHPVNEFAKIFWKDREAAGFYTVKLKGSLCCAGTSQCYQLPVLDTVFVRKKYRRLGLGLRMLSDFCSQFPADQDLGISRPISPAMYRVCHRYLQARPEEQDRLWEVESPGGWSQRENVWLLIQMGDIPSVDDSAQSRSI